MMRQRDLRARTRPSSVFRLSLAIVASLGVTVAASAETAGDDAFRTELLDLIGTLEALPAAAQSQVFDEAVPWERARSEIEVMDAAALRRIEEMVGPQGLAGSLEGVFAGLTATHDRTRALRANEMTRSVSARAEDFRGRLIELSDGLHAMGDRLPESLQERLDAVDRSIAELEPAQLREVMTGLGARRDRWRQTPSGAGGTLRLAAPIGGCTGDFPAKQICEIGALFDEVVSFFTETVPAFFVDVYEFAVAGLQELLALALDAIPTPQDFLDATGLTEAGWWNDVAGYIPNVLGNEASSVTIPTSEADPRIASAANGGILPCPANGTDIFLIGEVGTIDGYYSCKRSLEFLFGQVFKVLPKDEWGLTPKIITAVLYFPTRFLCTCYEKELFVTFWDDQLEHIAERTPDLDVAISTRASATSLGLVAGSANTLDDDTEAVDGLAAQVLVSSNGLLGQSARHRASLQDLQEARLREAIERDLARTDGRAVASFQRPSAYGGLLETARSAVEETVARAFDAGANTSSAERDLADGVALETSGEFKNAYAAYRKAYQRALNALK